MGDTREDAAARPPIGAYASALTDESNTVTDVDAPFMLAERALRTRLGNRSNHCGTFDVLEAMQLGLQALGPAHGQRNRGHKYFPKKQNPGSGRSRGDQ